MTKEGALVKMPALGDVGHARDTSRDTSTRSLSAAQSTSGRFDGVYNQLKQRVTTLKHEQQRVQRNQRTVEEMESVAVLEQRYRYEASIRQLEDNLAKAQEQLKATTERSSKMRVHFDREKKAVHNQLEQAKRTLEHIGDEHMSQVNALKASHEQEVVELRSQIQAIQQAAADREQAEAASHAAALEEVDQWCCGEIEAVRHVAGQEKAALEEEVAKWQQEFQLQRDQRATAEEAARDAEEQLQQAQEEVVRLTDMLAQSQMACESLQEQLDVAVEKHTSELRAVQEGAKDQQERQILELKGRHAQQLELINTRVQEVIAHKDGTISSLRQEIQALQAQMQQLLV